jgi:hypothetical protein
MCTEIFFRADVLDPPRWARSLQAKDDVAVLPPILAATTSSGHDVVSVRGPALGCNQFFDLRDIGRGVVLPAIGLTCVDVGADAVPSVGLVVSNQDSAIRLLSILVCAAPCTGVGRKVISAT